jgi:hypothetical protein
MRHPERSLKQISERMVFDQLIHLRDKEKLRPSKLLEQLTAGYRELHGGTGKAS